MEIKQSFINEEFSKIEWEAAELTNNFESVDMDNKSLGTPTSSSITGMIVRVVLPDKRAGIATNTNPLKWKECFQNAYKIAKVSKSRKLYPGILSTNKFSYKDEKFKNFKEEELFSAIELMRTELDNKATFLNSTVSKETSHLEYENHNQSRIVITKDAVGCSIGVGEGARTGYASSSKQTELPNFKEVVREAIKHYNYSKNNIKIITGDYPCMFAHNALLAVLQPVLFSLKADSVVDKKSKYSNKLNEAILSPKLTIIDNPHHENNRIFFDAEANKTRKTTLIENGVLKSFIHDTYTSQALEMNNTFNSAKIDAKPSVLFHNPEITGNTSFQKMLDETSKGLLFYDLYPEHTVNEVTGTFGLNSSTFFYIEKGEIKGLVKGGVVTGNSYEMLKSIDSISKETRNDLGSFNLPIIKTKAHILTQ